MRNVSIVSEHIGDRKLTVSLESKHRQGAEGIKRHLSSKENVGAIIKSTYTHTKKAKSIRYSPCWEGLLSDFVEY